MMGSDYEGQINGQELGTEIQRLRKKIGLSLKELAEQAGVSWYAIRNLEHGVVNRPKPEVIKALMGVLKK